MALTALDAGRPMRRRLTQHAAQHHDPVRRPEPDLHLARFAPGVPARVRRRSTAAPVATGKLLDGADGGLPTWADVKAQARDVLGIELTDRDVGQHAAAAHGSPTASSSATPTASPQLIVGLGADGVPNTADDIVDLRRRRTTPVNTRVSTVGLRRRAPATPSSTTSRTMLRRSSSAGNLVRRRRYRHVGNADRHRTAHGPATRVRQRTARPPLHHRRRPRQREHRPDRRPPHLPLRAQPPGRRAEADDPAERRSRLHQRVARRPTSTPTRSATFTPAIDAARHSGSRRLAVDDLDWDGERLFQAARFATEMQYQHLVFEEFARKIQPAIDPFVFNSVTDINPAIFAEFANVGLPLRPLDADRRHAAHSTPTATSSTPTWA